MGQVPGPNIEGTNNAYSKGRWRGWEERLVTGVPWFDA